MLMYIILLGIIGLILVKVVDIIEREVNEMAGDNKSVKLKIDNVYKEYDTSKGQDDRIKRR